MLVLGSHEKNTLAQLADVASRAERVALMADGHLGYIMPVGGVAAYRRRVSVAGVGFDIACGNCAIRTDLAASALPRERLEKLADRIAGEISFGIGRTNASKDAPDDDPLFEEEAWAAVPSGLQERDAPARAGARPARHGRFRQSLRGRLRRRAGPPLGRRPLRLARLRAHHRLGLHGDRRRQEMGRARARDRSAVRPRQRRGERYWTAHGARRALRLRRARVGLPQGGDADPRWRGHSSSSTTTTTSPGASATSARSSSSCARARRRHSPGRWASSARR